MTTVSLPSPSVKTQYRLPEVDRQAILAQSPLGQRLAKIEQQRRAFMHHNDGCAFGLLPSLHQKTE